MIFDKSQFGWSKVAPSFFSRIIYVLAQKFSFSADPVIFDLKLQLAIKCGSKFFNKKKLGIIISKIKSKYSKNIKATFHLECLTVFREISARQQPVQTGIGPA